MSEMMMVIRTDAGPQIGTGHVMRCLALAQAWQEMGGMATFLFAAENPALETRLIEEGMHVAHIAAQPGSAEDVQQTVRLTRQKQAAWVVVDSYHFGSEYQHALKAKGLRIFWIEDYGHAEYYAADWVLNQNIHADESLYRNRISYTRLLLGPRYALLRQEFLKWRGWRRSIPAVARKVLVTMGGGDTASLGTQVLEALNLIPGPLEVRCVLGMTMPLPPRLIRARETSRHTVRILQNVKNMAEEMVWADLSINAGGSTCWELCCLGVPMIVLVTSPDQRFNALALEQMGSALSLGEWNKEEGHEQLADYVRQLLGNPQRRVKMSSQARELVDGQGAVRVAQSLRAFTDQQ